MQDVVAASSSSASAVAAVLTPPTSIEQVVCMPLTCGFDDLKQVMSYAHLPHMRTEAQVRHAELAALRLIGGAGYVLWEDMAFYALW